MRCLREGTRRRVLVVITVRIRAYLDTLLSLNALYRRAGLYCVAELGWGVMLGVSRVLAYARGREALLVVPDPMKFGTNYAISSANIRPQSPRSADEDERIQAVHR